MRRLHLLVSSTKHYCIQEIVFVVHFVLYYVKFKLKNIKENEYTRVIVFDAFTFIKVSIPNIM